MKYYHLDQYRALGEVMGPLAEQVAVVTGAAQGIGAATARRLAHDGAAVAVLDLGRRADAVAAEIIDTGATAMAVECDVSNSGSVRRAIDEVVEQLGRLDILVNNAGITRDNLLFKMTDEDWLGVLATHLNGTFYLCREAQRHMVARKFGRIVNVSSRSALGNRGQVNYASAKAGIQGLTATLAQELGPFGITVNAVAPGYVATPMTAQTAERAGVTATEHQDAAARAIPLRRVAQPEEIASVIAFFAGPDSSFVTGQTLLVTGGMR